MKCPSTCGLASLSNRSFCVIAWYVAGPMRGPTLLIPSYNEASRSRERFGRMHG